VSGELHVYLDSRV